MAEGNSNTITYIFLFVFIVILFGVVGACLIYYYFLDPYESNVITCSSNNQCYAGSTCVSGVCQVINCETDTDCGDSSQTCVNGYCLNKHCYGQNDCNSNEACNNGVCVPFGSTCTTSKDCNNSTLQCINTLCQQCSTNNDCKKGQFCSNGKCIDGCNGLCAQGQTCSNNSCCQNDGNCGNPCSSYNGNNSTCKYCVNGVYTCNKGKVFETCTSNSDCVSNVCLMGTEYGNVCSYVEAGDCISNYNPNTSYNNACNNSYPFCVKGKCDTTPLNSQCGGNDNNTCRSQDLNVPNLSTQPPVVTYSYYCINSFCRENPGSIGEKCSTSDDCGFAMSGNNSQVSKLQCLNGFCSL